MTHRKSTVSNQTVQVLSLLVFISCTNRFFNFAPSSFVFSYRYCSFQFYYLVHSIDAQSFPLSPFSVAYKPFHPFATPNGFISFHQKSVSCLIISYICQFHIASHSFREPFHPPSSYISFLFISLSILSSQALIFSITIKH